MAWSEAARSARDVCAATVAVLLEQKLGGQLRTALRCRDGCHVEERRSWHLRTGAQHVPRLRAIDKVLVLERLLDEVALALGKLADQAQQGEGIGVEDRGDEVIVDLLVTRSEDLAQHGRESRVVLHERPQQHVMVLLQFYESGEDQGHHVALVEALEVGGDLSSVHIERGLRLDLGDLPMLRLELLELLLGQHAASLPVVAVIRDIGELLLARASAALLVVQVRQCAAHLCRRALRWQPRTRRGHSAHFPAHVGEGAEKIIGSLGADAPLEIG